MASGFEQPPSEKPGAEQPNPTISEASGLKGLDGTIGYDLRLAWQMQGQRYWNAIGSLFKIRPSQFMILKLVYLNASLRQSCLTQALVKKHANVVTALDELEERNLITRSPHARDKRVRVLNLTPDGEELTSKLLERYERLNEDLKQRFGARNLSQLAELLKKFRELNPEPDID